MRHSIIAFACAISAAASPVSAEVTEQGDAGFVTRDEATVSATPKQVWLALISPSDWWNGSHTWSGDAANLTLTPQAGGCFCERIPETDDGEQFTLEGSVEHMRVIQAYPESALRMTGALGPLQSEPVSGILTIAISAVDEGTRIVWEYNVGGKMRYDVPVISKAVDGVMTEQLNGLADMLGRIDEPSDADGEAESEPDEEPAEDTEEAAENDDAGEDTPPAPSVDDAFGDLSDED
ncbi:SRPBCC family protein [Erythrobacter sp. MTPC3]|uniref:SRPBCC family protein n=1 Tax=Erythrobacter sp. MTPC3 TaxID=3056564 RepID=UPI0036F27158